MSASTVSAQNMEEYTALLREKDILLDLTKAISFIRNKEEFEQQLNSTLKKIFRSNGMMVFLPDASDLVQNPYMFRLDINRNAVEELPVIIKSETLFTPDSIITQIISAHQPLVWSMSELMRLTNRPTFITQFRDKNKIKTIAGVSLANHLGIKRVLFLFSDEAETFGKDDLELLNKVSEPIALALQNILECEEDQRARKQHVFLLELIKKLLEVKHIGQLDSLLQHELNKTNPLPGAVVFLSKIKNQKFIFRLIQKPFEFGSPQELPGDIDNILEEKDMFFDYLNQLKHTQALSISDLLVSAPGSGYLHQLLAGGITSVVIAPFKHRLGVTGALLMLCKKEDNWRNGITLLEGLASQLGRIIYNIWTNEVVSDELHEVKQQQGKLEEENLYLQEEIQTTHNYSEIVGTSRQMKEVYNLVSQVAATSSYVLLLGETGTGKELIARAIHNASLRKDHVMVKVNCAVLPPNLIESELFGHEKGSFTDATERRTGKFELANNSTIFLDEIGELPMMLQAKLLRALQEKEIERVGGKSTIKVNVRVIAATNKDLLKEVQAGNFRSDLYFRLNVFPILLPSLRDRKEDIPLLANYFAEKYTKKIITKNIRFTSKAMKQLVAYNWPGNVRELEHLVERSVLMAKSSSISQVYLPGIMGDESDQLLRNNDIKTIDEVEREHILSVLKMVNGKVSGVGGAAEILKIPATTLSSKILRLKIKKGIS